MEKEFWRLIRSFAYSCHDIVVSFSAKCGVLFGTIFKQHFAYLLRISVAFEWLHLLYVHSAMAHLRDFQNYWKYPRCERCSLLPLYVSFAVRVSELADFSHAGASLWWRTPFFPGTSKGRIISCILTEALPTPFQCHSLRTTALSSPEQRLLKPYTSGEFLIRDNFCESWLNRSIFCVSSNWNTDSSSLPRVINPWIAKKHKFDRIVRNLVFAENLKWNYGSQKNWFVFFWAPVFSANIFAHCLHLAFFICRHWAPLRNTGSPTHFTQRPNKWPISAVGLASTRGKSSAVWTRDWISVSSLSQASHAEPRSLLTWQACVPLICGSHFRKAPVRWYVLWSRMWFSVKNMHSAA